MAKEPKQLDELFHDTLKDIYYAEKKILSALPKMAKAAQNVIALRMMKLAMGGKHAQAEASRMVTEKIAETMAVAVTLMSGGSGHAVVAQVRRRVRSNSRRLSR